MSKRLRCTLRPLWRGGNPWLGGKERKGGWGGGREKVGGGWMWLCECFTEWVGESLGVSVVGRLRESVGGAL